MGFFRRMPLLFAVMAVFLQPGVISGAEDLTNLDFSEASISQAGPSSFYIRSVKAPEGLFSGLVTFTGGAWRIEKIFSERDGLVPGGLVLDFATLRKKNDTVLELSGILYGGKAYKGEIQYDGADKVIPLGDFEETAFAAENNPKAAALKSLKLEGCEDAKKQVETLKTELGAKRNETAALNARISGLAAENEGFKAALTIMNDLASAGALDRKAFSRTLLEDFHGAKPKLGTWIVSDSRADQMDGGQYFAKLTFPALQERLPTLYSFQTRSTGGGWVGVGLHIYVSGSESDKGYGEGRSLLVWLTRDPKAHHNDFTYLQVYRSGDDVRMERVLDAKIEEQLSDFIDVDVLYDPEAEYVTVFLGGVEKVRYKTFFGIDGGVSIALRTLGAGGAFRNLRVSTPQPGNEK